MGLMQYRAQHIDLRLHLELGRHRATHIVSEPGGLPDRVLDDAFEHRPLGDDAPNRDLYFLWYKLKEDFRRNLRKSCHV